MMSNTSMYGVVLWTDETDRKAVIWCEDHGDLAFYTFEEKTLLDGHSLDAGDLVQFDMREEHNLRLARNPQRVVQAQYPGLAKSLSGAQARPARRTAPGGTVVSFSAYAEDSCAAASA